MPAIEAVWEEVRTLPGATRIGTGGLAVDPGAICVMLDGPEGLKGTIIEASIGSCVRVADVAEAIAILRYLARRGVSC